MPAERQAGPAFMRKFLVLAFGAFTLGWGILPAQAQFSTFCVPGKLIPIVQMNTTAPYPAGSYTAKEEGPAVYQVTIGSNGVPTEVLTAYSTGYPRLDAAGASWIKSHWRWEPLISGCQFITTQVVYNWSLSMVIHRPATQPAP